MVEKVLHAGNIAVAFSSVATAADLTVTGGAGAAISASLSATDLFKHSSDKNARPLATQMAAHMQGVLDRSHLTDGRKRVATQMLARYAPSKSDLAAGNMDAPTVATTLRTRIAETATDPAHKTEIALDDFRDILADTLAPFLEPQDDTEAMLQELLARTGSSGQSDRLRNEGITETAIIRLAQRIARETDDLGQAWLDLQNAMDIAVRVQQEGRLPSNHGDFVDEVLARVTGLAAEGEYTAASNAIATALEADNARRARLLDSGIEIAMLEGNSTTAAEYLIAKADLEAGGAADFDALRAILITHYETGRDKGIAIDLEISIALARLVLNRARTSDERGTALNDLGVSLRTLGDRESGTARLEEAVIAYRTALEEFTRDRVPLDWARTQMNLGAALTTLGERETGIARLEEAVTAYRAALAERTRDRVPLEWARTHANLAGLECAVFDKTGEAAHLERAEAHARAAQEVFHAAGASHYEEKIERDLSAIAARRGG